jgi:arylsulfatase A-like enzyme
VDDRSAQTIDVVPTIADELGIAIPWRVDGKSLLRPDRPYPSRIAVASHEGGVVEASWRRIETGRARTIAHRARVVKELARLQAALSRGG